MVRALNTAVAFSLPALSAVISFCCYIGIGHTLDPARIFTALSLFQLLRQPLMLLPTAFSALTDAYNATKRLTGVGHCRARLMSLSVMKLANSRPAVRSSCLLQLFEAETMDTTLTINPSQPFAVQVSSATFEWVGLPEQDLASFKKSTTKSRSKAAVAQVEKERLTEAAGEPFKIPSIDISIPKGSLTAIVGAVGSGKSSLLQGLIGEMKLSSGSVSFSGRVAYW